ncbi:MAG: CvpA family protein, partial [Alistipes sp.]|nr:CvpA family protein [Alistipes sp.]
MNLLDLIVCLALVVAVWNGWRSGVVVQVCSLAGLLAALWAAARYGAPAGEWLRLDEGRAAAGGCG